MISWNSRNSMHNFLCACISLWKDLESLSDFSICDSQNIKNDHDICVGVVDIRVFHNIKSLYDPEYSHGL
jgi:hypothetical protein